MSEIFFANRQFSQPKEEHWIPLSDLMTGLMIMFMLVAIIFMLKVESDAKRVKDIALIYDDMRAQLYQDLHSEFDKNLPDWGAELERDLTLRFKEPNVLFDTGKDTLKPKFSRILDDFFPRYVRILSNDKYRSSIEEIRIEGHTSSVWNGLTSSNEAYFLNMALSQSRTRSTLQYVLSLPQIENQRAWLRSKLTANGLSSSKLIYRDDGSENQQGSQRVEFRVRHERRRSHFGNSEDCQAMKLPDFYIFEPLNDVKKKMGIPNDVYGTLTIEVEAGRLTELELEKLTSTSGLDVSLHEVTILDNGTLGYKNSRFYCTLGM